MDEDVTLLHRATDGDHEAAESFYRRHVSFVWNVVRRFCANDDDALDASQEAFLRVFRGSRFSGRSSLRTWLFRVASSAAIDLARAPRTRSHERLEADPSVPPAIGDPLLRQRVAHSIAGLPPALRDVFVLCEVMDVSHEEAAALLGIPVGTSRRRLFDARERLRAELHDVMQEWRA